MSWYNTPGSDSDVVISSRVRFARNLTGYPFPAKMTDAQRSEVIGSVTAALRDAALNPFDPASESATATAALVEKHYISPEFAKSTAPRMLLYDEEKMIAVMIGEEDHVRIQAFAPGLALGAAYDTACAVDSLLDAGTEIAYSEKLGYLTQCPTNLGTAMRASVMLHLPALVISGQIGTATRSLSKLGITVRGIFGEGSEPAGALYQVSNSVTMGLSEREIIEKLEEVVGQLIETERKLRSSMKSDSFARLCDRVMRAHGTLTHAYMLGLTEFMSLWSDVRLGAACGILESFDVAAMNRLMVSALPANLRQIKGIADDAPEQEQAILRAAFVRTQLK